MTKPELAQMNPSAQMALNCDPSSMGTNDPRTYLTCPRSVAHLTPAWCVCRLFLENSRLEHSEDENSILGQGGSGTVIYRARYQSQPVAVKRFQIKKFKNFANVPAGKGALTQHYLFCFVLFCFFRASV
jgi:hypothetical protein